MTPLFMIFIAYALLAEVLLIVIILIDTREIQDNQQTFRDWYMPYDERTSRITRMIKSMDSPETPLITEALATPFPLREYAGDPQARGVINVSLMEIRDQLRRNRPL